MIPCLYEIHAYHPPRSTVHRKIYRLTTNAVDFGYIDMEHVQAVEHSDVGYIAGVQLCHRVALTEEPDAYAAPASAAVSVVIGHCPEIQVRHVDAFTVIAGVQDTKVGRDRAVSPYPRELVRAGVATKRAGERDSAIPARKARRPFEAFPDTAYLSVETLPELRVEGLYRDKLTISHGEPPFKVPAVRPSGSVCRASEGRFYCNRSWE